MRPARRRLGPELNFGCLILSSKSSILNMRHASRPRSTRSVSAACGPERVPAVRAVRAQRTRDELVRTVVPAITDVNYSARIRTLHCETNAVHCDIIDGFLRRTGCPAIVNTSFNARGEPIVCTIEDASMYFMGTNIEDLVRENFVVEKAAQSEVAEDGAWRKEFVLD